MDLVRSTPACAANDSIRALRTSPAIASPLSNSPVNFPLSESIARSEPTTRDAPMNSAKGASSHAGWDVTSTILYPSYLSCLAYRAASG